MNSKELLEVISEGESSKLEFKRKLNSPDKLAREISAFANTKGGILLVGVDDDGSIVGVQSEKTEIDIIETTCAFHIKPPIIPSIEIINLKGYDIVVVYISESKSKPHFIEIKDTDNNKKLHRAYIRLGEKSVMASREMYRLLSYQNADSPPLKISIGEREKRLFNYLQLYEKTTLNEYAKLVNISKRRAERILIKLVRAGVLQIHNDSHTDFFTLR
jgi:predicted HTH transcriptional regulator